MFGDLELGPDAGAPGVWRMEGLDSPQLDAPKHFCFSPKKELGTKKHIGRRCCGLFFWKTVFSNMKDFSC